jgi:hypothetical protein
MAKGGYASWNPMNWFKSAPEEPLPVATAQPAPTGGPYGGKKRKSKSKTRRVKKATKKTGRRV